MRDEDELTWPLREKKVIGRVMSFRQRIELFSAGVLIGGGLAGVVLWFLLHIRIPFL
jgi:uncharacterized membrane protein YccC